MPPLPSLHPAVCPARDDAKTKEPQEFLNVGEEFFKEPQEFLNVGEEFPCGYLRKTRGFFVKTIGFFVKTIGFFVSTMSQVVF